jgi:putative transposase
MATEYPLADDLLEPLPRAAMPRAGRLYAPGETVHVVARCNNREYFITAPEDFEVVLTHLKEMRRNYCVTLYAYTLMSNHVHLLLQAPTPDALGRPLRWFMTETARAFHKLRRRRGHFWERRHRACLVDDDRYALAALRYLDRNPVRAGLVEDPVAYPWSSSTAYALGAPNPIIAFHPSYLSLSPYAKVRQRHYRALLAPSADPRLDAREPRWTQQRAVGSAAFLRRHLPPRELHRSIFTPQRNQTVDA